MMTAWGMKSSLPAWTRALGATLLVTASPGCVGNISDSDGAEFPGVPAAGVDPPSSSASYVVPVAPLRRLSRREYNNTVRDLLGDSTAPADAFTQDPVGLNGYELPGAIGTLETEAYLTAAENLATAAKSRLSSLMPCSPKVATEEEPCAAQFVRKFGPRVYRRPLRDEEASDLLAVYKDVRLNAKRPFQDSVGAVLQAMLASASFIYHREIGPDPAVVQGDVVRLTNYEVASRLSYFITGTTPDDALLQAAAAGKLTDVSGIDQEARRLAVKSAVVAESVTDFVRQWLILDIRHVEKSKDVYPDFAGIQPDLLGELLRSMGKLVQSGAPIEALFTDRSVYVTKASAKIYGVSPPPSDQVSEVVANPGERAGVFTQLAFLSVHASAIGSHPVKRGSVLLQNVLCGTLPPPPPNVPEPEAPKPGQTTRERFAAHGKNACANCHKVMDPLGFAFEVYDGIGRYRTVEEGKPVDASGSIWLPSGDQVMFQNGVELLSKLAKTTDVATCLARQLGRYGAGTANGFDDAAGQELLQLVGSGRKLADLFVSVVKTRAFRYRQLDVGEVL